MNGDEATRLIDNLRSQANYWTLAEIRMVILTLEGICRERENGLSREAALRKAVAERLRCA